MIASPLRARAVGVKVRKGVATVRRHGARETLRLLAAVVVEPVVGRLRPPLALARRRWLDARRRRSAPRTVAGWRARREEVLARGGGEAPPAEALCLDLAALDRARRAAGGEPAVLADVDQDGFLRSHVGPLRDAPTVPPHRYAARRRFDLQVVDHRGRLGVRKRFRGDAAAFVAELSAAHDLRAAGCRVPAILDVDFDELTITFAYVLGSVLREELARRGAALRDRDVAPGPAYRRMGEGRRRSRRILEGRRVLDRVVDARTVDRLFAELRRVHAAGYVLRDIKYGNVVLDRSGEPWLIDFDRAGAYPELGPLAFRCLRDRDYERFNAHFGTERLTARRAREAGRRLGPFYAPVYVEGGLRFGPIWKTEVGHGRWRYLLRHHLPPLEGARVLDLGANNGFNGIQMLRHGAAEVVAVEVDDRAIAQGAFVRELFEWADNREYRLRYVREDMARLPDLDLGTFDLVTALCSLYYLEDEQISRVVGHVSTIAPTLVLEGNTDRRVRRSDPHTHEKASLRYAVEALRANGFPRVRVVAPRGYSRPLVIGHRGPDERRWGR